MYFDALGCVRSGNPIFELSLGSFASALAIKKDFYTQICTSYNFKSLYDKIPPYFLMFRRGAVSLRSPDAAV